MLNPVMLVLHLLSVGGCDSEMQRQQSLQRWGQRETRTLGTVRHRFSQINTPQSLGNS